MVYQNEKIRPPFLGAYELFICPCNLSHPFPYPLRNSSMTTMPSVVTKTSKGRDSVVKPTG